RVTPFGGPRDGGSFALRAAPVVRCAIDEHRKAAPGGRAPHVSAKDDAVPHGDGHVALDHGRGCCGSGQEGDRGQGRHGLRRGREGGASTGMVRRLRTTETGLKVIETDARADWGSSGGPLLALDGRVVGVLSFKLKGARRSKFAVPINHARRLISSARASPK